MFELDAWLKKTKFPALGHIEVRFAKGDDVLLSPCQGRDTCYINIVGHR